MKNDEVDAKFKQIAAEIKVNADWRALLTGNYSDEMVALDEIAKQYGGENWNTGGGIYVAVLPLGPHDAMGVTGECICHYHNSRASSMVDVFDEPDNDTSDGMVSLCPREEEAEAWRVISPDGIPICPETFSSEAAARQALADWCKRYEAQGYYASVEGRISLEDLPELCEIKMAERRADSKEAANGNDNET